MVSGSEDCMIKIWDWEYGDCVRTLLSHSFAIWGLALDEEENLASASW
jgi:WD40 repeat protein